MRLGITTAQRIVNSDVTNKSIEIEYANKTVFDNKAILKLLTNNKEKLINVAITFLVKASSEQSLIDKSKRLKLLLNGKGFVIRPLINFTKSVYENTSPSHATNKEIFDISSQLMTMSSLTKGFLNATSSYTDLNGFPLCKTINGQTLFVDTWKREANFVNGNICIFGTSGVGKSTIAKYLLALEWANSVKCIVMGDPEREFRRITLKLGGSWINVNGKSGKINPLQINIQPIDNEDTTIEDVSNLTLHIQNVKTFIKLIFEDINTLQETYLSEKLIQLYKKFNININTNLSSINNNDYPLFSDLYDLMLTDKNKDNDYRILLAYIKDIGYGSYMELWNEYTNINMNNSIICFDTSTLQNSQDNVKRAQYFLILNFAWEYASKDKKEKVRLFLDEAHLLVSPKVVEAMATLKSIQKRCRKYEASTTIITQSVSDFLFDEVKLYGQALLEASALKIIMGSDGKGLQDTINALKLPDMAMNFLSKRERGKAIVDIVGSLYLTEFDIPDFILDIIGHAGR